MGNRRRKLDIVADILSVIRGNARKTQIMYQANLSYLVLQKYLADSIKASLIRFEDENHYYVLTAKGREFLSAYEEFSRAIKHVEKRLSDVRTKKNVLEMLYSRE